LGGNRIQTWALKKPAALEVVVTDEDAEALQRWLKNHP
jgi:hypothetical protein